MQYPTWEGVLAMEIKKTSVYLSEEDRERLARLAERKGHFFPPGLLDAQYAAMEPLAPDEDGFIVDVALDTEAQVRDSLRGLGLA